MPNKLSVSTAQSDPSGEKDLCFHLTWPTRGTGSKAGGSVVKVDVENRSDSQPAIFKFKTTNPKRYLVVPNQGFILPGETETVELVLLGEACRLAGMGNREELRQQHCNGIFSSPLSHHHFPHSTSPLTQLRFHVYPPHTRARAPSSLITPLF